MNNPMKQTDYASSKESQKHLPVYQQGYDILHHGAVQGVTGSCHELQYLNQTGSVEGILIDCGLFQGIEAESSSFDGQGSSLAQDERNSVRASLRAKNVRGHSVADDDRANLPECPASETSALGIATNINFEINHIKALVVTHVHIDHVGRIPYLLAKGFKGPIYCSEPSAHLLPLVLEDALKVGFTRNKKIIEQFLSHIEKQIVPVPYSKWQAVSDNLQIKLKPAGHILGSAYVLCKLQMDTRLHGYDGVVGGHPVADNSVKNVGGHPVADKSVRASLLAKSSKTILFSGDLGAPYSPILKSPKPPFGCDQLVLESTYGDKNHENRKDRRQRLKVIIEKALEDQGTVLIPAFSIGRTQELLYELEQIIHENAVVGSQPAENVLGQPESFDGQSSALAQDERLSVGVSLPACAASEASAVGIAKDSVRGHPVAENLTANPQPVRASLLAKDEVRGHPVADNLTVRPEQARSADRRRDSLRQNFDWNNLEIIIDSPLAAKFTEIYSQLAKYWDKEARRKLKNNRNPLNYNNVLTINGHKEHLTTVDYLAKTKRPAIVIAASGMCNGGRIMNYLKAMLQDKRHDVLFVGYQAKGTIGRIIQKYGPNNGYVDLDGQRITINAKIHTIGGYSAHAGQKDLINFVRRMWKKPKQIRLIHGDEGAKQTLKNKLNKKYPKINTWIPVE